MNLVQVNKTIIEAGSETRLVTMTGIDSNNVYMLALNNVHVGGAGGVCDMQPTTGGSADTTNNFQIAWTKLNSGSALQDFANSPQDIIRWTDGMQEAPHSLNGFAFLYNFYNASEYSLVTMENVYSYTTPSGFVQGGTKAETTSHDGIHINTNQTGGGGFQAGSTFVLYKVI